MSRRIVSILSGALVVSTSALASAQAAEPLPAASTPASSAPELPAEPKVDAAPRAPEPARTESTVTATASTSASTSLPPAYAPDAASAAGPPRHDLVRINAGVRLGYMGHRGFDTFAKNDVLTQFSLDGTYPIFAHDKLVLAAGLGWDVGGRSDSVRGVPSSLTAHRFYVPIEARYAVLPGLGAFLKVAPGASLAVATIDDSSVSSGLSATGWAFSADASVGASILLGPRKRLDRRVARFWITPEIGYAFTTVAKLSPDSGRSESDLLGSDERTNLRSLALSGLFWRASLGATF